MKPTPLRRFASRPASRRGSRIMSREVDDLYDESLSHLARSPWSTHQDPDAVPPHDRLSFDSWMAGTGLRPLLT